jgi:hypothetical protein
VVNDVLSKFVVSHPRDFFFSSLSLSLARSLVRPSPLTLSANNIRLIPSRSLSAQQSKCARAECLTEKKKCLNTHKKKKILCTTQTQNSPGLPFSTSAIILKQMKQNITGWFLCPIGFPKKKNSKKKK